MWARSWIFHDTLQHDHPGKKHWALYHTVIPYFQLGAASQVCLHVVGRVCVWKCALVLAACRWLALIEWIEYPQSINYAANQNTNALFNWHHLYLTWGTPNQSSACCMASLAFCTGWFGSHSAQSGHRPDGMQRSRLNTSAQTNAGCVTVRLL